MREKGKKLKLGAEKNYEFGYKNEIGSEYQKMVFENRIAKKLLTVDELALKLGVSGKTIYGWIYRGLIKPIKVGPRLVRFNENEVEQWISKNGDS